MVRLSDNEGRKQRNRCLTRTVCMETRPRKATKLRTSSTARGGGGSFKKRKTIGEIGCCESRMSKQKH